MNELSWWCYIHENGTLQVKRYLGPIDLEEADESPFVKRRTDWFMATSREDAIAKGKALLGLP